MFCALGLLDTERRLPPTFTMVCLGYNGFRNCGSELTRRGVGYYVDVIRHGLCRKGMLSGGGDKNELLRVKLVVCAQERLSVALTLKCEIGEGL